MPRYIKDPYGPYVENLRHVASTIEVYFVSGYADGGNPLDRWLELLSSAHWALERESADPADDMIS